VLLERARRREHEPERASDATLALVDRQLGELAPLDEVPADRHLVLRTDRQPAASIDELEARLDHRLASRISMPS
jgi:hypothetical protein